MIKNQLNHILVRFLSRRIANQANAIELKPKINILPGEELTPEEKIEIYTIWSKLARNINFLNFSYWELYKCISGFNPLMVPDDIYVKNIVRVLNPIRLALGLQNKNLLSLYYSGLRTPKIYLSRINGNYYDSEGNYIKDTQLKNVIPDEEVIIKPSSNSCSGEGVICIDGKKFTDSNFDTLSKLGKNWVCQEKIHQSPKTAIFNSSSLNTFRVNTLYLNGYVSVTNIMFRHGRNNSLVDNAGAGGCCWGFDENGHILCPGIDAKMLLFPKTPFDEPYQNIYIPELKEICAQAKAAHKHYLPFIGHVAWDIALDTNNAPVFIEVNLGWPGIMTEQLSSRRPIFNDRVAEVIEYAQNRQKSLAFEDFLGRWT